MRLPKKKWLILGGVTLVIATLISLYLYKNKYPLSDREVDLIVRARVPLLQTTYYDEKYISAIPEPLENELYLYAGKSLYKGESLTKTAIKCQNALEPLSHLRSAVERVRNIDLPFRAMFIPGLPPNPQGVQAALRGLEILTLIGNWGSKIEWASRFFEATDFLIESGENTARVQSAIKELQSELSYEIPTVDALPLFDHHGPPTGQGYASLVIYQNSSLGDARNNLLLSRALYFLTWPIARMTQSSLVADSNQWSQLLPESVDRLAPSLHDRALIAGVYLARNTTRDFKLARLHAISTGGEVRLAATATLAYIKANGSAPKHVSQLRDFGYQPRHFLTEEERGAETFSKSLAELKKTMTAPVGQLQLQRVAPDSKALETKLGIPSTLEVSTITQFLENDTIRWELTLSSKSGSCPPKEETNTEDVASTIFWLQTLPHKPSFKLTSQTLSLDHTSIKPDNDALKEYLVKFYGPGRRIWTVPGKLKVQLAIETADEWLKLTSEFAGDSDSYTRLTQDSLATYYITNLTGADAPTTTPRSPAPGPSGPPVPGAYPSLEGDGLMM